MILNEVNTQGRCCCPISQTCLHNPNRLSPQHSGHLKLPRNRALETLLQKTQVPGSLQECATRADLDHVVDGRRVGSVVVGGAVVVIEADGVDAAGKHFREGIYSRVNLMIYPAYQHTARHITYLHYTESPLRSRSRSRRSRDRKKGRRSNEKSRDRSRNRSKSQDGDSAALGLGGDDKPKRKRRSRWGAQDDLEFIPGMPVTLPPNLTDEQQRLYLSEYIL